MSEPIRKELRKMKQRKNILAVALAALLCVLPLAGVAAAEIVQPTDQFYVGDYANVINSDTEQYIVAQNEILEEKTGAQVVVVTVDFTGGMDIEDYAYDLFNEWGIGSSEKNNGVLILMVIGEENYWAMQGSGIENVLTSSKLGDLLYDYLEPDFAAADYDAGAKSIFDAVSGELAKYYGVSLTAASSSSSTSGSTGQTTKPASSGSGTTSSGGGGTTQNSNDNNLAGALSTMVGFIVVILILVIVISTRSRRGRYYGGYAPRTRYYRDPFRRNADVGRDMRENIPPNAYEHDTQDAERDDDHNDHFPFGGASPGGGGMFGSGGGGVSRGGGAGRSSGGGFGGGGHSSGGGGHSGGGGGSRGGGAGRR